MQTVRVEGYHEVLALHRMFMECKSDDLGSVYAGSPFIAAIQHRLADALEAADPGQGWHDWRNADGHPYRVQAVRAHLTGAEGGGMTPTGSSARPTCETSSRCCGPRRSCLLS